MSRTNDYRLLCVLTLLLALLDQSAVAWGQKRYRVTEVNDARTQNEEFRLMQDGVHFGTILVTKNRHLAFRPHPDPGQPDGWGMSWFVAPYLKGADSRGLIQQKIATTEEGISLLANGGVASPSGSGGSWMFEAIISYSREKKLVSGSGAYNIELNESISTTDDLTLFRLNSNYLSNVKLDDGTLGNTGDARMVRWDYETTGPYRDSFIPTEKNSATYPQKTSPNLRLLLEGNRNVAAGDGTDSKVTPDFQIHLVSKTQYALFAAGIQWDPECNRFDCDNFGVMPLILKSETHRTLKTIAYEVRFSAEQPSIHHESRP